MSKRSSRRKFIFMGILALIGIVLTVFTFPLPFSSRNFNGFAKSVDLGIDLKGGISATYTAALPDDSVSRDLDKGIVGTVSGLTKLLSNYGFKESRVFRVGDDKIQVEVPSESYIDSFLSEMGKPLLISKTEEKNEEDIVLRNRDIKSVKVNSRQTAQTEVGYGVDITFTREGSDIYEEVTEELAASGGNLYFYLGDTLISTVTISQKVTDGKAYLYGGSITSKSSAEVFAIRMLSGSYGTNLTYIESNKITPIYGQNTLTLLLISSLVALAIAFVFMWLRYGHFGLLSLFSFSIFFSLMAFFMQALPFMFLNFAGIVSCLLCVVLFISMHIVVFEKIREEYASGKKIPMSTQNGFKRSFFPLLDVSAVLVLITAAMWALAPKMLASFAMILMLGTLLTFFSVFLITRFFCKWYLAFNSTKAGKLRFKREDNVNELG